MLSEKRTENIFLRITVRSAACRLRVTLVAFGKWGCTDVRMSREPFLRGGELLVCAYESKDHDDSEHGQPDIKNHHRERKYLEECVHILFVGLVCD